MAVLQWSSALQLNEPAMDETHREFVALLNQLDEAGDGELPALLDAFITHTESHFAREERWMEATAFPPLGCHRGEHENVLEVMHEVRRRVAAGELHYGRTLAAALAEWFPQHAQGMDAVLAMYLRDTGFVPGAGV